MQSQLTMEMTLIMKKVGDAPSPRRNCLGFVKKKSSKNCLKWKELSLEMSKKVSGGEGQVVVTLQKHKTQFLLFQWGHEQLGQACPDMGSIY